jgi:cation diffusion facilitator CzcD-associated flavoprotein CzcO
MASPAPLLTEPPLRAVALARAPRVVPHHRIVIVGAGFGGLGMAIRLKASGERDFVVLEKGKDVGGTWRDNTYPGCQCDVPSNLYSFSFAPNLSWSRTFAWQPEILEYLKACTDRYGVRPHVRFETELVEARWDEAAQRWRIETNRGSLTADILVSAHGGLSAPSIPELPGMKTFRGTVFHSAAWQHDHDLSGERVGVVGTGASAIQIVPAIQPKLKKLAVFQRTPAWIVPRLDRPFSERKKRWQRRFPVLQLLDRVRLYMLRELVVLAMTRYPRLLRVAEKVARAHLSAQVRSRELRKQLSPSYSIGCKRILLSNDFYPALCASNVELVSGAIREVTPSGVVTNDGVSHELDTIILCTGFKVTDHPILERVRGRDGRTLTEHWSDGAAAYLGTTVAGFPNLFLLSGPNTGVGHTSLVYMIESQHRYVLGALAALRERRAAVVEVRPERVARFSAEMRDLLAGSVWNSGCASWYLDARGRNTSLWPTFSFRFRQRTRRFDQAAYMFEPQSAAASLARQPELAREAP